MAVTLASAMTSHVLRIRVVTNIQEYNYSIYEMITFVYILNIEREKILGFRMQGTVKIICKVPCLRPKSSKELAPNKGK